MWQVRKIWIAVFSIFVLSFFFRTIYLHIVPVGIEEDNINFVLNAKSVFHTGKDITGTWHPLLFTTLPKEQPQSELAYLFLAIFIGVFPLTLFTSALIYGFISSLTAVFLYLLTRRYLGDITGICIGILNSVNPWSIFFGRTPFEAQLTIFFFLLGWVILLYTSSWRKMISILPFLFAFYTYMGFKLIFLPYIFLILLSVWVYEKKKKLLPVYLSIGGLCVAIFVFFLSTMFLNPTGKRVSELTVVSKETITNEVTNTRQLALQSPLTPIFINKGTVLIKEVVKKYLGLFSPEYLFLHSEYTPRYEIKNHGYFYILDIFLLLPGFFFLYKRNKQFWFTITGLVLLSPIPAVLNNIDVSYASRAAFLFPLFCIYSGVGLSYVLSIVREKKRHLGLLGVFALFYFFSILSFLYTYLHVQPVYASEASLFSTRVVVSYITRLPKEQNVVVITQNPRSFYKQYLFYSGQYNKKQDVLDNQIRFATDLYEMKNVKIIPCNRLKNIAKDTVYFLRTQEKCSHFSGDETISISQLKDGGEVWKIYQDALCSSFPLLRYPQNLSLKILEVDKLSTEELCKNHLFNLD